MNILGSPPSKKIYKKFAQGIYQCPEANVAPYSNHPVSIPINLNFTPAFVITSVIKDNGVERLGGTFDGLGSPASPGSGEFGGAHASATKTTLTCAFSHYYSDPTFSATRYKVRWMVFGN